MYPRENQFIDEEIILTKSFLKRPETLKQIYLEDFIALFEKFNSSYAQWLSERYIL